MILQFNLLFSQDLQRLFNFAEGFQIFSITFQSIFDQLISKHVLLEKKCTVLTKSSQSSNQSETSIFLCMVLVVKGLVM